MTRTLSRVAPAQALSDTATDPPADPCAYEEPGDFTLSLHIGGVFAVLFASTLGAAIPLLAAHWPRCAVPPFFIALGKCVGTGVVLACGLIHMLQVGWEKKYSRTMQLR